MADFFKRSEKEIADELMLIVNSFSFSSKELYEEFKGNKQMEKLVLYWLRTISSEKYREYHVDLRNEISARRGQELAQVPFIKRKIDKLPESDKMKEVCEQYIIFDHHTLHQTFSGFCFYFLLKGCTEKQQEKLKNEFGETFYRMPLI